MDSTTIRVLSFTYDFLGLLHTSESLSMRGRRLQETAQHRQTKQYAPDVFMTILVQEATQRLDASFVDDEPSSLWHGELTSCSLRLENLGTEALNEIWFVHGNHDLLFLDNNRLENKAEGDATGRTVHRSSNNVKQPDPVQVDLGVLHHSPTLEPSQSLDLPLWFHASESGDHCLYLLVMFRAVSTHLPVHFVANH